MSKIITSHISDTHSLFNIKTGSGNILFHHGDATNKTYLSEMDDLNKFFTNQLNNFDHIIYTPGNHDVLFEDNEKQARSMIDSHGGRVKIFINEGITLYDFKIFCSPFSLKYKDWAFMKDHESIGEEWKKIPMDTEILITHSPPYGVLDYMPGSGHLGCNQLRYRIDHMVNLKLHGFGHIHEGAGITEKNGVFFVNAATVGGIFGDTGPFNALVINWEDKQITNIERAE